MQSHHNLELYRYPTVVRMSVPVVLGFSFFLSTSLGAQPNKTWQENWFEHNQLLTRYYFDDHIVIYFDPDVDRNIHWLKSYLHDIWEYVKKTYGNFGDDPRLYAIFHTKKYFGCHATRYFNPLKLYRNVIDCGLKSPHAWSFATWYEHTWITWVVADFIQAASHGVDGWVSWAVSNQNFYDIIVYDLYAGTNRTALAQQYYQNSTKKHEKVDGKEVYWFRDWYWKIYKKYGGSKVLNRFLKLTAQHFPKRNSTSLNGPIYERDMTWGEFFHFWNAATGTNLKSLAGEVFGWKDKFEKEFTKAKADFPDLNKLYDYTDEDNKN